MRILPYGVLLLWGLCWLLLAVTSNAAQGLQFTAPVLNTAVHWLAYGLSPWVGWWLSRPPARSWFWGVRTLLWAALGLQWAGLGLSWGLSVVVDSHPSPLGYFASTARWDTRVVCYKGPVQVVNQYLTPPDRTPALDFAAQHRLPPSYEHTPAYPQSRTVLIEPLLPGLQWISCEWQSSSLCGCCYWSGPLDASWTVVDSAQVAQFRNSSLETLTD